MKTRLDIRTPKGTYSDCDVIIEHNWNGREFTTWTGTVLTHTGKVLYQVTSLTETGAGEELRTWIAERRVW